MKQKMSHQFGLRLRRVLSGVLCAVMLCGLLPEGISLSGSAQAAEAPLRWSSADLQTLNDYGIMRGNENGDMMPDKSVTRAEFVAMINRSLGYNEKAASSPFKDVASADWFSDDISISYNMGYFSGTSKNTASPYVTLTREQALVALGRNLMLQPTVGESFSYADTRSFGSWSRGYIDPAVEAGIIDANRTGDFNPQKIITRGELAGMVVRTLGTRISTSGLRNLGTVDGNVTITTSNVTLRNTTINGDLYLTGGIGLGDVHLDNVTVRGKIVDAGAGLSEKGDISVILNNVTAEELVVDSMRNQTVSLRTSGTTSIPKTSVRTSAYLDDSTSAGYGLRLIEVDGEEKTAVTLSGNIKEVHNKTPKSSLNIGEGVADKVTVDEAATGSTVTVGKDARVKELNLDAGIKVDGSGSIDKVSISANGATVAQLPDEIVIAPGITATVNKQKMDTAAAVEASSRPRLASGYPYVPENNINPTGATALFMTNKPGTIYWALTAKASGSPSEEDIISPPSYAKYILKFGKIQAKESNKEYTAKISGLTSDGSYYLSAILVDDRGSRSTMKVTAFDTPDNTTPAFSTGYPTVTASEKDAQLSAMTTKNCYLYYTVLPKGSTAPRGIDFQTGSITGNLGYGVVRMAKNSPTYIYVNDVSLEEKQPYVLYLWLTDFDGAKSSAVKAVNFTTQDRTDPIVTNLRQTKATTTSVTAAYALNEPGTLYWAVVKAGDKSFMSPTTSGSSSTNQKWLESREAMERIIAGTGALKNGKSTVAAAKVGADVSFTVSGLNSKTTGTSSYDLYYVAVDAAGNWSKPIRSVTIYTEDNTAPTVVQKFTSFNEGETEDTLAPLADTDIRLVFSKPVRVVETVNGYAVPYNFMDAKADKLQELLKNKIRLYEGIPGNSVQVTDPAFLDYSKAEVYLDGVSMVVNFSHARGAVNLAPGTQYYFVISDTLSSDENRNLGMIQDTTANHNEMPRTTLKTFTTKQAQVNITPLGLSEITGGIPVDFSFELEPRATGTSPESICYDIVLWADKTLTFDVYRKKASEPDTAWKPVGTVTTPDEGNPGNFKYTIDNQTKEKAYYTVNRVGTSGTDYPALRDFLDTWQYAIHFKTVDGKAGQTRLDWNISTHIGVSVVAGQKNDLRNLANGNGSLSTWNSCLNSGVSSIGNPPEFERLVTISDSKAPNLYGTYPQFEVSDTSAVMNLMLDRPGTIYYVVTPVTNSGKTNPVPAVFVDKTKYPGNDDPADSGNTVPEDGTDVTDHVSGEAFLSEPSVDSIISKNLITTQGSVTNQGDSVTDVSLEGLQADTWYYVYLAFKGNVQSEQAVCYKFKTEPPYTPQLTLDSSNTSKTGTVGANVWKSSSNVYARLFTTSNLAYTLFNWTFNDLATKTHNFSCGTNIYKDPTDTAAVQNMTVLDAMMTLSTQIGSNASLFDEYASDALKTAVTNIIKTGNNDQGVDSIALQNNKVTIAMGSSANLNFGTLDSTNEYFCVAVAENTSDATKQGFSAARPVRKIDTTKPVVSDATGTLLVSLDSTKGTGGYDDANHMAYYVVEGDVTITYTGTALYLTDATGTRYPFTQGGGAANTGGFFDYPGVGQPNNKKWAGVDNFNDNIFYTIKYNNSVPRATNTVVIHVKYELAQSYTYGVTGKDTNGNDVYDYIRPSAYPAVDLQFAAPSFVNSSGEGATAGNISITSKAGSQYAQAKKG